MTKPPTKISKVPTPAKQKKRSIADGLPRTGLATGGAEAARLLAEADSFLRLGLVDKAIEHLEGAVGRDRERALRELREPLVKLYVSQGRYDNAIAELWALLSPCEDPQDEIRFLRYILRLDGKNAEAEQRLRAIRSKHDAEASRSGEVTEVLQRSVNEAGGQLRAYLGDHRPPTDFAQTVNLSEAEARQVASELQQLSGAVTRENLAEVAALADEMAFSSGPLKDLLDAVDDSLHQRRYAEARQQLQDLLSRCPYSARVRSRLALLEQAMSESAAAAKAPAKAPAKKTLSSGFHSAPTLPPWTAEPGAKEPSSPPARAPKKAPVRRQTLELTPVDIEEEHVLPVATPRARRTPPPPPPAASAPANKPLSEAARTLQAGTALRSAGQLEQALALFEKARGDAVHGVTAALMAGLCHRELGRPQEAIAAFRFGVSRPDAGESALSEIFYELGATYELLGSAENAILHYRLSLGAAGSFRDADRRIATLKGARRTT